MDFTYTDEQKMLKRAARRFLAEACPNVEWHLEMDRGEKGFTQALWNGMAELGWMGIVFPEEYGGIGGSMLDMVTLMEEMGYAALPGPYFSTVVLGGCTILGGRQRGAETGVPAEDRRREASLDTCSHRTGDDAVQSLAYNRQGRGERR